MILQHINDIAAICAGQGIQTAIISPGSRSAPLTLAFARHPELETKVIADERSAAFIALGIAQQQQKPVALICTSGSAAYNYAPAIAEAYFQEVPLLILTADRPPEWTNQYDGQTIQQQGIYGKHVKASFDFPDNFSHPDIEWHANRIVNEAILSCTDLPMGPVHINVPLREPFYPETGEKTEYREVRLIKKTSAISRVTTLSWETILETWKQHKKRLIIGGQMTEMAALKNGTSLLSEWQKVPVISDIISNLHGLDNSVYHQDAFLSVDQDSENEELTPDLLITFGKSNISKNLKRFIRKHKPSVHWHIQPHNRYQDTFQSLTDIIPMEAGAFLEQLALKIGFVEEDETYLQSWKQRDQKAAVFNQAFFNPQPFGEFKAVKQVMEVLPENSQLHLSNSMTVRYANFLGLSGKPDVTVFCNRGTSGIDGSNSTAVGAALSQGQMVTLITGDMAFFYDRNAFWHKYSLSNLRIILLNNHAGGIFRLIKGPSDQPELEEYFETEQALNAENTAKDFKMGYISAHDQVQFKVGLKKLYEPGSQTRILEVVTKSVENAKVMKAFKSQ